LRQWKSGKKSSAFAIAGGNHRWAEVAKASLAVRGTLAIDMLLNGMFVSDTYEVVKIPTAYLLSWEQAHDRAERLRADWALRHRRSVRGRIDSVLGYLSRDLKRRMGMDGAA
jgi:hypothetical protein